MANAFDLKPKLDPIFPVARTSWVDPESGLIVPKTPTANLQWRARILDLADEDESLQDDLYTACSKSLLFWINAFVFTLRIFEPDADTGRVRQAKHTHLPMLTWDIQDVHLKRIEKALDKGEELLTDKSRDMGATWNHIAILTHRLLFRSSESHLIMSRKEDAVDILDGIPRNYPNGPLADPGTLFGKIDYILSRLPEWMVPSFSRKKMHLVNLDNKSRIDGESANATAGSSDRRTSIFLDEMAKMSEGESIQRSTRDVTACRLVCSTPNGAGTAYSKWRMSGMIPVFILPWWEHPEKGKDRYVHQDDLGRWKIRSPWYDQESEKRSAKEMAIEIDMDHVGSGDTFFEGVVIEEHKKLFARPHRRTIGITFRSELSDDAVRTMLAKNTRDGVTCTPKGPWKVWPSLFKGRLDQQQTYTLGVDISKGMGASNSTINVMCNETHEKVAAFADANIPPYELAKLACAACLWVGGRSMPLLIWENNGDPGFDFGRQIVRTYQYPNIYFDRAPGTLAEKQGKRYGWRSTPEKKATGLGILRRAYAHGGYINHDELALNECLVYVHYDGGGIGPAMLVTESASARKCHGDRVIADMLCLIGADRWIKPATRKKKLPKRSIGYRMQQWKRQNKRDRQSDIVDLRTLKGI